MIFKGQYLHALSRILNLIRTKVTFTCLYSHLSKSDFNRVHLTDLSNQAACGLTHIEATEKDMTTFYFDVLELAIVSLDFKGLCQNPEGDRKANHNPIREEELLQNK